MKKQYMIGIMFFLMIFSIANVINTVAFDLDPGGTGGDDDEPSYTSHTISTTVTYELRFVDAFTRTVDTETVTMKLTIKYDYSSATDIYYYTYYSFDVSIEDTDRYLSRVNYDTYVLQIAGQNIVYTSKDVIYNFDGWSKSGSLSSPYDRNNLHIWFGVYTEILISGEYYETEYIIKNSGTSNTGWTYYYGDQYLGNWGDIEDFCIFEWL